MFSEKNMEYVTSANFNFLASSSLNSYSFFSALMQIITQIFKNRFNLIAYNRFVWNNI